MNGTAAHLVAEETPEETLKRPLAADEDDAAKAPKRAKSARLSSANAVARLVREQISADMRISKTAHATVSNMVEDFVEQLDSAAALHRPGQRRVRLRATLVEAVLRAGGEDR
jgi:histone H3/H4